VQSQGTELVGFGQFLLQTELFFHGSDSLRDVPDDPNLSGFMQIFYRTKFMMIASQAASESVWNRCSLIAGTA
jgi:hypothetical protein